MPVKEPVLCYVSDLVAFFTTQELFKQGGDDWDDCPYELNAGEPYRPCWHGEPQHRKNGKLCQCGICERDWNKDGTPKWEIVAVAWEGPLVTPVENFPGLLSVQDINFGATPWLMTALHRSGERPYTRIMAGTTISEFIKIVKSVGGRAAIVLQ